MARGNSRQRRKAAARKVELLRQDALLRDGYDRRDALIRSNLAKKTPRFETVTIAGLPAVLTTGFASSVSLVSAGADRGRGTRQWGTTVGEAARIARQSVEADLTNVSYDPALPKPDALPKDRPLYPTDFKWSKERGGLVPKGFKRFSQK